MAALKGRGIEGWLSKPDPAIRAALIYGPDAGLVRERAAKLLKQVAGDASDPFKVAKLSPQDITQDPARLADEAAAIPFGGGRRVVWITGAEDNVGAALAAALAQPGDGLIVLEAGNLSARGSLRKLCEEASAAVTIPCYADEGDSLAEVIRGSLAAHQLRAEDDAFDWLLEHLGADRGLTRAEIDKLALYMGGPGTLKLDDVAACIGDGAQLSLDDLVCAAAEGDQETAQRMVDRLFRDGMAPVAMLRILLRHFEKLNLLGGLVRAGKSPEQAVEALRPPPFFRMKSRLRGQVSRWPVEQSAAALDLLQAAEVETKTTGLPAEAICGRAVLQLARAARRSASNAR